MARTTIIAPSMLANVAIAFLRFADSFNGRFRDECLNEHVFSSYAHARNIIEDWRNDYNQNRSHTSLNGLTPTEFANRYKMDHNMNRANL
jgi:putative transposase